MNKIAILFSQDLANKQGIDDNGYRRSVYNEALQKYEKALDALGIEHMRWQEEELDKNALLIAENIKVLIVPQMRVCSDKTFIALRRKAEQGWIVFATWDSFYYAPNGNNQTKRVENRRFPELFQLTGNSPVCRHCWLEKGEIRFSRTRFSWLTNEVPDRQNYSGGSASLLALVGESNAFSPYGEIIADQPKNFEHKIDTELVGRKLPAFMIREYPSGGIFIYACFQFTMLRNFTKALENICDYESRPAFDTEQATPQHKEIKRLRTAVIVLTTIVFLLLAREMVGDSWVAYLGGAVLGIIIGILGNKATHALDGWLSR